MHSIGGAPNSRNKIPSANLIYYLNHIVTRLYAPHAILGYGVPSANLRTIGIYLLARVDYCAASPFTQAPLFSI